MIRIKLILFILFAAFNLQLSAQEREVTISGFITDLKTGEALIGSNILLYKESINFESAPFRGTAANSYGFYAIPKLSPEKYIIIIRHIG